MRCFPKSYINSHSEIIIHEAANEYFKVDVDHEIEYKYKVLEWLSRAACKTEPFRTNKKNHEFKNFMLVGINEYLNTDFTREEMWLIYAELGNSVNRPLTEKFVESGYDMEILKSQEEK
ncbi:MAG TPA: hypothetical protein DHM90_05400 [Clostridiaceae bacterium]|nr:hypothetical protein [Clostridiaceae bacterium]